MISHENFSSISLVSLGLFRSCAEEKISCKRLCVYTCCEILPTQLHPEPHIHKLTCWNKVDRSPLWLWIYCIGLYFCEKWGQTGLKPALWSTEFKHGCGCRASGGRPLHHSSERPQQVQGSYIESMVLRHFSGPGSTSNSELPEGHSRAQGGYVKNPVEQIQMILSGVIPWTVSPWKHCMIFVGLESDEGRAKVDVGSEGVHNEEVSEVFLQMLLRNQRKRMWHT